MSGVTKAVRRTVLSVVRRAPVPAVQLPDHATILSAMPVAVVVLSEENRFTYANPAAEQFLGLSASCAVAPTRSPITTSPSRGRASARPASASRARR
jgi:PAS domain-containing protein